MFQCTNYPTSSFRTTIVTSHKPKIGTSMLNRATKTTNKQQSSPFVPLPTNPIILIAAQLLALYRVPVTTVVYHPPRPADFPCSTSPQLEECRCQKGRRQKHFAKCFPKTYGSVLALLALLAPSWLSSNRAWKTAPGGCYIHITHRRVRQFRHKLYLPLIRQQQQYASCDRCCHRFLLLASFFLSTHERTSTQTTLQNY